MTSQDSLIPTLVSAEWLHGQLSDPLLRVVDVRWYLTEQERGLAEYQQAHIPGAVFMKMEHDLAALPGHGPGRHPLPTPEAFATAAGQAGIGDATHVVAYDSSGGAAAARLWWLLRYFGHTRVSLLDGGWQAWLAAGYPTDSAIPALAAAHFTAVPHPAMVVDAEAVERMRRDPRVLLLDARANERFEGRVEPIDPQAGHIPGARSAPFAGNLREDGRMKDTADLRDRFVALGADTAETVVCYCGSGVTAAHNLLALHLAGRTDALLYAGSWSDWSSEPTRPVAVGPEPVV